jgi:hypothetical protein
MVDFSKLSLAANPLVCTWLELRAAFAALHLNIEADVTRLHDVYVNSVPDASYRVALPGEMFDERRPRPGDNLKHVINPLALAKWIEEVSAKHGFPYTARQALNIAQGIEDYGF